MIADTPRARPLRLRNDAGQRLLARDLQDEHDLQSWRRAIHVAALHDTWGIAIGLTATIGAGEAIIGPGLAYDCFGREIILSRDAPVPGPIVAPGDDGANDVQTLVVRYNADLDAHPARADAFPCVDLGGRPGREEPLFAWRRQGEVRLGLEVPLLAAQPTSKGLTGLDLSVRRYARALVRPHIAAGATEATQPWEPWEELGGQFRLGVQTRVDTSDAGFVGRPTYLATLRAAPKTFAALGQNLLFTSVANPAADGFIFRVAQGRRVDVEFAPSAIDTAALRVDWIGVEPVSGCVPLAQPQFVVQQILLRRAFADELSLHFAAFGGLTGPNPPG